MTVLQRFNLKNRMLVGNVTANLISAVVITNLVGPPNVYVGTQSQILLIQALSTPLLFLLGFIGLVWYELPMRRYITRCGAAMGDLPKAPQPVLRRLLNEPFFAMALDLFIWILAATFWATYYWQMGEPDHVVKRAFLINLHIGLITIVVAFFLLEHIFQKKLASFFFPNGRIYEIAGTIRVSIRVRLAALLFACNLIPFLATIQVYFGLSMADDDPAVILDRLGHALINNSLIFMAVGLWLWGVEASSRYTMQRRNHTAEGSLILLGTDGIWETCNARGEMFGKERVLALLKNHARDTAGTIRDRLVEALQNFRGSSDLEDDITMVAIKPDRTVTARQVTAVETCTLSQGTGR